MQPLSKEYLLNLLLKSKDEVNALVLNLSAKELSKNTGKWNVEQHLKHVCYSEKGLLWVANRISKGEEGTSEDFDLNSYNNLAQEKLLNIALIDLLDEFNDYISSYL